MKKINFISILSLSIMIFSANAQDYSGDAFKYSQLSNPAGTARMKALGGDHAAIGADVSNISGNPAGLGLYSRSEFSFTFGNTGLTTDANYIGTTSSVNQNKIGLDNIAMVFGNKNGSNTFSKNGWKSGNFGVSYNRNSNLFNSFSFTGLNNKSSIMDSYAERINRNSKNTGAFLDSKEQFNNDSRVAQSPEALYYQMYTVNPSANGGTPFSAIDAQNPTPSGQTGNFNADGKTSQWTFAYGANYNDKLYLGVSGGIGSLNYDFTNNYNETLVGGKFIESLSAIQLLAVKGQGVNVSGGFIFRPNNQIRIGGTIHSPTWTSITESFDENLAVTVNKNNTADIPTDLRSASVAPFDFDYELRTPLRGSLGLAVFVGKKGFITADAEYVGYSGMKLSATTLAPEYNASFSNDNKRYITQDYKNVVNLKLGAEMRVGKVNLRGGVAALADPYKNKLDGIDRSRLAFSGGAGYKSNNFYVDVTGAYTSYTSSYSPYVLNNKADYASAKIDSKLTTLSVSLGTFF